MKSVELENKAEDSDGRENAAGGDIYL